MASSIADIAAKLTTSDASAKAPVHHLIEKQFASGSDTGVEPTRDEDTNAEASTSDGDLTGHELDAVGHGNTQLPFRRVSSDSKIANMDSHHNIFQTLQTFKENGHITAKPARPKLDRNRSTPMPRTLTFGATTEMGNAHDQEPDEADPYAVWNRFFSVADGWLDRLRNKDDEGSGRLGNSRSSIGDSGESSSMTPTRPRVQRRATTSTLPDRSLRSLSMSARYGESSNKVDGPTEHSQRWKDLKSTLRFINFTKKKKEEEIKYDHEKSTELITELMAGVPAGLILALSFKRDEKNQRRLPVLLQQLKVKITDSTRTEDRQHAIFRIELEYGSGPVRMKWVVYHDFRDFFALHSRLHVLDFFQRGSTSRVHRELPSFPREAIPYLRGVRGLNEDDIGGLFKRTGIASRHSVVSIPDSTDGQSSRPQDPISHQQKHFKFNEKQRIALETYLKDLIKVMVFQGEANRLCRFFELSAMGLRLAIENSYHGKEGPLTILSTSSARGWRVGKLRPKKIKSMFTRFGSKWFLIRHSYILVVDSFLDIVPVDVFMVDSEFKFTHKAWGGWHTGEDPEEPNESSEKHKTLTQSVQDSTKIRFTLKLENSERKMKLMTLSEKHMKQWQNSIEYMQKHTLWSKLHRFESFAPVRQNVSAQCFVDGRDYFWNVSHAIEMARDVIYIHDWWLSPEIYLRRPGHGNQQWRLDRLLKRKAEEGVKIFVILYRNVGAAIPIDSQYTKQSLLDLHPNIFVARSPNQFRQNILFWAHHEKLVIIDHLVLFVGGLDLCFGRWDTPQHVLTDDKPTGFDRGSEVDFGQDTQLWVGKDYSNARVQDFYELNRPYDDMYDRSKVPRMPWHDVHMQVIAQPARDAARHFVQRWNYLIRQKRSTRPTPVLLPPPDFTDAELEALGHLGTCEVQLLRSACGWSLGMLHDRVEHSIVNAYLKAIEQSEHFVYIENQFFITSTTVDGTVIENEIGDALVERIMRAHKHREDWRAIIIIPLMPGFEAEVHQHDGTSVRLIMQCQYRSISRGPNSIFGRLERVGINPEDYIQFFSLRKWGKIGPHGQLVTEQLYIHAKIMIVDDRAAIIGSANINERSMRGSRDSEVAVFVRDTDQVLSSMGGKPFMVGRLPHTLRVRLMREHLGIDVDALENLEREHPASTSAAEDADLDFNGPDIWKALEKLREMESGRPQSLIHNDDQMTNAGMYESDEEDAGSESTESESERHAHAPTIKKVAPIIDPNDDEVLEQSDGGAYKNFPPNDNEIEIEESGSAKHKINPVSHAADLAGFGPDNMNKNQQAEHNMRDAVKQKMHSTQKLTSDEEERNISLPSTENLRRSRTKKSGEPNKNVTLEDVSESPEDASEDSDSGKTLFERMLSLSLEPAVSFLSDNDTKDILDAPSEVLQAITPFSFEDPLEESFYFDIWLAHAVNNTNIYRDVFRCQPDNEVQSWKDYQDYMAHAEKFAKMQSDGAGGLPKKDENLVRKIEAHHGSSAGGVGLTTIGNPIHALASAVAADAHAAVSDIESATSRTAHALVSERTKSDQEASSSASNSATSISEDDLRRVPSSTTNGARRRRRREDLEYVHSSEHRHGATRRSRRHRDISSVLDKDTAESRLKNVRGHLILFPNDWLLKEDEGGNWFYNIDRIPPIEIYD